MHLCVQLWFATSVTQTNWITSHPSGHVLMSTPTRAWQGCLFQKRLSPEHYVVQVLGDKGKTNLGMELIVPSFETDLHYVTIHSPARQWHAKCQWYSSILQLYYSLRVWFLRVSTRVDVAIKCIQMQFRFFLQVLPQSPRRLPDVYNINWRAPAIVMPWMANPLNGFHGFPTNETKSKLW
jgi:hypothetical protein